MALDNYANLKQAIKRWSHREDVVGEVAEDCVTLAEQEIFFGDTPMRLTEMITEDIVAVTTKTTPFPEDMVELIALDIEVDGIYYNLRSIPISKIQDNGFEQCPAAYAITSQILFDHVPDKSYNVKFTYYKKPTALSDSNPVNIVLTKYPNAYLFGGVASAMQWAGEEDRMNEYVLRMRDVISKANSDADNLAYGALPTVFIDGYIP